jgi:hypothetical protein
VFKTIHLKPGFLLFILLYSLMPINLPKWVWICVFKRGLENYIIPNQIAAQAAESAKPSSRVLCGALPAQRLPDVPRREPDGASPRMAQCS